ncbi:MAG: imidazoleglycerol-phosphate dehydratase HisB [Deltaproteobacteria bacterium]|nr:imidazoleglycerol-phosphate dehydratase HisB [Deltaproteobacteria bacterium]
MQRKAHVDRKTTETDIKLSLTVDGTGTYSVDTPVGFLNHMLELFAKHGIFDLSLKATGDVEIDYHHTVEDIAICLGQAVNKALGDRMNIKRYGDFTVPMDEARARVTMDISGRPYLVCKFPELSGKVGEFDLELVEEFFQAFVSNSGTTLHITVESGRNTHHIIEAIFKAFGRALDAATALDARGTGIPSTKGTL